MNESANLQMRAATLARLTPMEWAEFVKALAAYVEIHRNNLVNSPLPELPINQGRAHMGTTLVILLDGCLKADEARKAALKQ